MPNYKSSQQQLQAVCPAAVLSGAIGALRIAMTEKAKQVHSKGSPSAPIANYQSIDTDR